MTTASATRKPRTIKFVCRYENELPGLIRITEGGKATPYAVRPIPSDWGKAFELTKLVPDPEEASVYHVCIDVDNPTVGGKHHCECKGFLRWGHRTLCRHVAGLLALLSRLPAA